MPRQLKAGMVDVSVRIRIIDATDGTPETGVVPGAGLALEYERHLSASVAITETALGALTTAHTDGGFLHVGNGYYRVDLPDAACAVGATGVLIHGSSTGMVVIGEYIELVAYDPFDVVRMGLTALPNAAAQAAGGLYTRGTGAGQINQAVNGQIDVSAVDLTPAALAEVNTEVDTALTDLNLDHLVGTATAIPAVPAGTYLDQIMDNGTASYDRSIHSLQAAVDNSADLSDFGILLVTTIASLTSQIVFVLTAGSSINDSYLNQTIALYDVSNGLYPSVRRVADYVGSTRTITLDSAPDFTSVAGDEVKIYVSPAVTGGTGPTAVQIADEVQTRTIAAVTTVNGLAANTITATSIAAGALTAAKFAAGAFDAVWTVATRELTAFSTALALSVWHVLETAIVTASTIGLKVKTNLDATISSRSTYAGADTAGTTTLLSRIIGTLAAGTHQPQSGDSFVRLGAPVGASHSADVAAVKTDTTTITAAVDTEVAAIKAKTDQLTFTTATKVDATIQAAGDFAQAAADKVWASAARTLTAFSTTLALSVWDVLEAAIVTANSLGVKLKTNVDAAISSRSTYAGADTAGTTTLLSRIIGTLATGTHQPQSGDSFTRLGTPAGASVSADIATRLAPTVAGRTLDVSVTGEAGLDWANIGAPTTAQGLSGTTIGTATAVTTVNGLAANSVNAAALATDAVTEIQTGLATSAEIAALPQTLIGPAVTVVADGANSATAFEVNVSGVTDNADDWWLDAWLSFDLSANVAGQTRRITDFNQTTGFITVANPYTTVPATGAAARLVTR